MYLTLQEFCDMDQLYKLLDNWSKSCGMATMLVDAEGIPVSEDFGMTEFCKMVQSCEKGLACCRNTWSTDCGESYECPFGFQDFSIPIALPNVQVLGKVLAGQALSDTQKDEYILQKAAEIGLEEKAVRDVLSRVHRKTEKELRGSYELLRETLCFFVEKSYSVWKAKNELRAAAAKNQILSELTKMLYSYNLTLNLRSGKYSMIIGTGMTQFMDIFRTTDDYEQACRNKISYLDPAYIQQFAALAVRTSRMRDNQKPSLSSSRDCIA